MDHKPQKRTLPGGSRRTRIVLAKPVSLLANITWLAVRTLATILTRLFFGKGDRR